MMMMMQNFTQNSGKKRRHIGKNRISLVEVESARDVRAAARAARPARAVRAVRAAAKDVLEDVK